MTFQRGNAPAFVGIIPTMTRDSHSDKVVAMQKRLDGLSRSAAGPFFLVDQFKVIQEDMKGEPFMPIDEGFGSVEVP